MRAGEGDGPTSDEGSSRSSEGKGTTESHGPARGGAGVIISLVPGDAKANIDLLHQLSRPDDGRAWRPVLRGDAEENQGKGLAKSPGEPEMRGLGKSPVP
jgi:hypothetical protein